MQSALGTVSVERLPSTLPGSTIPSVAGAILPSGSLGLGASSTYPITASVKLWARGQSLDDWPSDRDLLQAISGTTITVSVSVPAMAKSNASVSDNPGSSGWAPLSAAIHRYALPTLPKPMKMLGIRRTRSPPPLTDSARIIAATHRATTGANGPAPPVGSWSVGVFRKGMRNAMAAATAATTEHPFTVASKALRQFTVSPF